MAPIIPVVTSSMGAFNSDIAGDTLYMATNFKAP